jgi:hypothetical protein
MPITTQTQGAMSKLPTSFHSLRPGHNAENTDSSDPLIGYSFEINQQGYLCSISNHAYYFTASMAGS